MRSNKQSSKPDTIHTTETDMSDNPITLRDSQELALRFKKHLEEGRMDRVRSLLSHPRSIKALIKMIDVLTNTASPLAFLSIDDIAEELLSRSTAGIIAVEFRTDNESEVLRWVDGPIVATAGLYSMLAPDVLDEGYEGPEDA